MNQANKKTSQQVREPIGDTTSTQSANLETRVTPALPETFVAIRDTVAHPLSQKQSLQLRTPGVIFKEEPN